MRQLLRVKLAREKGLYEVLPLKMVRLIKEFGPHEELSFIIDDEGKKVAKKSSELKGEEFELKTKNNIYKVKVDENGLTDIQELNENHIVKIKRWKQFNENKSTNRHAYFKSKK